LFRHGSSLYLYDTRRRWNVTVRASDIWSQARRIHPALLVFGDHHDTWRRVEQT
jgi:hypothetical protein